MSSKGLCGMILVVLVLYVVPRWMMQHDLEKIDVCNHIILIELDMIQINLFSFSLGLHNFEI